LLPPRRDDLNTYDLAMRHSRQLARTLRLASVLCIFISAASAIAQRGETIEQRYFRFYNTGQVDAALTEARKLKDAVLVRLGDHHANYATALNYEANAVDLQGHLREAEALYRQALAIDESLRGSETAVARDLGNLADNLQKQVRYDEAEALFRRSLSISEAVSTNSVSFGLNLSNLAVFYTKLGRFNEAEGLLRRALPIFEQVRGQDRWSLGTALSNLATVYVGQGRYDEGEALYKRAYAVFAQARGPEHFQTANEALFLLAKLYQSQQRFGEAEALYKRTLAIFDRAFGVEAGVTAELRNHLAKLYRLQGRYAEAEVIYRQALSGNERQWGPAHPLTADTLNGLAVLYRLTGAPEAALSYARRASAALVRSAANQSGPSNDASRGFASQRQDFFRNHVAVLAAAAQRGIEPPAALGLEAFEMAQLADQSAAAAALQKMGLRFAAGTDALAGLVRESQDLSAYWRTRDDALIAARSRPKDRLDPVTIDALRKQLTETESKLAAIAQRLEREFPDYATLAQPKPLSVANAQKLLGADDALLLWLTGEEESYVFAATRSDFQWQAIPVGAAALASKVKSLRVGLDVEELQLKAGHPLFDLGNANDFYRLLVGPIEKVVRNKKHLIVVPSGPLTSLPLHLLVTEPPSVTRPDVKQLAAYKTAAWLIKRHAISVLPSVASLNTLRTTGKEVPRRLPMVGYGDPIFSRADMVSSRDLKMQTASRANLTRGYSRYFRGSHPDLKMLAEGLSALPETADELRSVGKKLGASETDIHLGSAATEAAVKRADLTPYRVVYFATHGLVAGEAAGLAEPALVLTLPAEATDFDDGLLTASEITQLKLNADWVVLSACNTAAGDKPGAEALSGLARAFFYAGARALLVSHWRVDSVAATRLTTGSFEALQKEPSIGRAEALRRAMLTYMNDTSNPWNAYPDYWGPFSIVGEGGQ
jgi:CHAT domain-containing protein